MQAPFYLAPGFKYEPTDKEICDYLQCKQIDRNHHNYPVQDYDVYGTEPWLLPVIGTEFNAGEGLSDHQYYIVEAKNRQRKAGNGYWKATGKEKAIADGLKNVIGYTRALTYYSYPKPERKTNWIMHEYRLLKNADVQWTMCKIGETGRLDSAVSAVPVEHQQQDQLKEQQQQLQQQQHQILGLMGFEVQAQQDWNAYLPEVEKQNHHQQQQQQQQQLQQQQQQNLGSMDFEVQAHQDCDAYLLEVEKQNHQQQQQQQQQLRQQQQQQHQNLGLMGFEVQAQQDWNADLPEAERQNHNHQQQQPHQNLGSMEFEVQAQQDWNAYLLEVDKGTNDHGLGSEDLWQSAGLHSFQEYQQTPSNIWDDMDTMGEVFQATNLTFNF